MATPLTSTDIAQAKAGHFECTELEKELDRMRSCGLNCDEASVRNEHLKQFFRAIQEQYGPLVSPTRKT